MQESPSLTLAEEYSVWSERIRTLFGSGTVFEDMVPTRYDRGYSNAESPLCEKVATSAQPTSSKSETDTHMEERSDANKESEATRGNESVVFYDESSYPLCFYTRMLRNYSGDASHLRLEKQRKFETNTAKQLRCEEQGQEDVTPSTARDNIEVYSSASQHLYLGDDALAARLASKLRARTAENKRRQHEGLGTQDEFGCIEGHSFCDPKVEAVQSKLYEEMTDLLLSLRKQNAAAAQLKAQLTHTKLLMQRERTIQERGAVNSL